MGKIHKQLLRSDQLTEAAALLVGGGIVALPTDTVYGLAAHPSCPGAIARLFVAKQRPLDRAIPILLADARDLDRIARDPSAAARTLAGAFWPGALTLVVPKRDPGPGDLPTVAVRVPASEVARALIRAAGGALAVTSANLSGGPNTTTALEVLERLDGRIDAVLDGGRCEGGVESTIVDTTCSPARLLRQGAIDIAALRRVVDVAE